MNRRGNERVRKRMGEMRVELTLEEWWERSRGWWKLEIMMGTSLELTLTAPNSVEIHLASEWVLQLGLEFLHIRRQDHHSNQQIPVNIRHLCIRNHYTQYKLHLGQGTSHLGCQIQSCILRKSCHQSVHQKSRSIPSLFDCQKQTSSQALWSPPKSSQKLATLPP